MDHRSKRERAPAGIEREHPISLRLKPEERLQLETAAANRNCTVNAVARKAVLIGLNQLSSCETIA